MIEVNYLVKTPIYLYESYQRVYISRVKNLTEAREIKERIDKCYNLYNKMDAFQRTPRESEEKFVELIHDTIGIDRADGYITGISKIYKEAIEELS